MIKNTVLQLEINLNSQKSLVYDHFPKAVTGARNVLSNYVPGKEKSKKDAPSPKAEDETKALALAQAKSSGNACFTRGKKVCCINSRPQKHATEHKKWAMKKRKILETLQVFMTTTQCHLQERAAQGMQVSIKPLTIAS